MERLRRKTDHTNYKVKEILDYVERSQRRYKGILGSRDLYEQTLVDKIEIQKRHHSENKKEENKHYRKTSTKYKSSVPRIKIHSDKNSTLRESIRSPRESLVSSCCHRRSVRVLTNKKTSHRSVKALENVISDLDLLRGVNKEHTLKLEKRSKEMKNAFSQLNSTLNPKIDLRKKYVRNQVKSYKKEKGGFIYGKEMSGRFITTQKLIKPLL